MEGGLNSCAGRPKTQILGALDMKILGHPDVGSTQDDQTPEWPFLGCDYFTIIQALLLFRIHTWISSPFFWSLDIKLVAIDRRSGRGRSRARWHVFIAIVVYSTTFNCTLDYNL